MDPQSLQRSVDALSQFLVGAANVRDTLGTVAQLAVDAVGPADFAGITLLTDKGIATGVFTDPLAPEIDQAQYDSGRGPCLDSFRTGEVLQIPSTRDDVRWPEFSRAALDHGINSTLSLPMAVGEEITGALNLYANQEDGFGEDAVRDAGAFALHAAVVMANTRAFWQAHDLTVTLQEAIASRATIEQAKGILMHQSKIDAEGAFKLLVAASQRENRKLREIARELVDRHAGEG